MQKESRIWSNSGVEPAAGDEVYAGQERPVAEYDNWAMWAITKDIDTIATVLGDLELVDSVTKVTFDTEVNRPADSQDGHVYFEVDTGEIYGYSGGSWTRFDALGTDSVGTSELDLSISPTWTGNHRFDGGITLAETRSVTYPDDAGAQTLADVPVSSSPAAGTEESMSFAIDGTDTFKVYAEADGAGGIQKPAVDLLGNPIRFDSSGPLVRDDAGAGTAIQYDTDVSDGQLTAKQAGLAVQGNSVPTSGAGLEMYAGTSTATVKAYDRTNGTHLDLAFQGGLYDFSGIASNIRLATGQAIEDGSGTDRLWFRTGTTFVNDGSGDRGIRLNDGTGNYYYAESNQPWVLHDDEGGFEAVRYLTSSSSPGSLDLTNARLRIPGDYSQRYDVGASIWGSNITGQEGRSLDIAEGDAGFMLTSDPGTAHETPKLVWINDGSAGNSGNIHYDENNHELVAVDNAGNETSIT